MATRVPNPLFARFEKILVEKMLGLLAWARRNAVIPADMAT